MKRRSALALTLYFLGASVAASTLYDKDGLVVEADVTSQRDVNTGQRQQFNNTTITFQGIKLCGKEVALLLYPDAKSAASRAFFCPGSVQILDPDGVLAFFNSSSADSVLAQLKVINGALRVQRIDVSKSPDRNKLHATRFMDGRLAGWTRIETAWQETVLIRHAPLQTTNLGKGRLLDIDGTVAYLAVPPGSDVVELQPATRVKDAYGYMQLVPAVTKFVPTPLEFRAVRLADGQELARLNTQDLCLQLPNIEFERNANAPGAKVDVRYDDVPAWRASALQLTQAGGRASLRLQPGVELPRKANCKPA